MLANISSRCWQQLACFVRYRHWILQATIHLRQFLWRQRHHPEFENIWQRRQILQRFGKSFGIWQNLPLSFHKEMLISRSIVSKMLSLERRKGVHILQILKHLTERKIISMLTIIPANFGLDTPEERALLQFSKMCQIFAKCQQHIERSRTLL